MKEHLVKYISYINNILAKVNLIELIVLKVGSKWLALVGVWLQSALLTAC